LYFREQKRCVVGPQGRGALGGWGGGLGKSGWAARGDRVPPRRFRGRGGIQGGQGGGGKILGNEGGGGWAFVSQGPKSTGGNGRKGMETKRGGGPGPGGNPASLGPTRLGRGGAGFGGEPNKGGALPPGGYGARPGLGGRLGGRRKNKNRGGEMRLRFPRTRQDDTASRGGKEKKNGGEFRGARGGPKKKHNMWLRFRLAGRGGACGAEELWWFFRGGTRKKTAVFGRGGETHKGGLWLPAAERDPSTRTFRHSRAESSAGPEFGGKGGRGVDHISY